MRKSKFSDEQIIAMLKQAEGSPPSLHPSRRHERSTRASSPGRWLDEHALRGCGRAECVSLRSENVLTERGTTSSAARSASGCWSTSRWVAGSGREWATS